MDVYYFPIDKIEKSSNVIIYGNGLVGKQLVEWNNKFNYCNILAIIDKKAVDKQMYLNIPVIKVEKMECLEMCYDYILIASKIYENEIELILRNKHVCENKIVKIEQCISIDIGGYYSGSVENAQMTALGKNNFWGKDGIDWYSKAELDVENTYEATLKRNIEKYDLLRNKQGTWLDFGCGQGRMVQFLRKSVGEFYCCDISEAAIEKCNQRFSDMKNVHPFVNTVNSIPLKDNSIDVVYSLGTMVGFDFREMDTYLKEIYRVLKKNGFALIHHSNWRETEDYLINGKGYTHSKGYLRGDVGVSDVQFLANKSGFKILEHYTIPWGKVNENIDAMCILRK